MSSPATRTARGQDTVAANPQRGFLAFLGAPVLSRRWYWTTLRIIALTFVGIVIVFWAIQKKLIYFPMRELEGTPAEMGLDYEDVSLTTSDGLRLHGWYVPAPSSRGTVLYFHGNAGNVSHRTQSLWRFHDLGVSTFIIDYRGYGQSEGEPSEEGTYIDAEAAWDYLRTERNEPAERILLYGRSLGGAVAVELAARHDPAGLIVDSSFTSIPDLAKKLYPFLRFLPLRTICRHRYESIDRIADVQCPLLVLHSPDDRMIPISHGRRLADAAPKPGCFVQTHGDHNESFEMSGDVIIPALREFLRDVLPKTQEDTGNPR